MTLAACLVLLTAAQQQTITKTVQIAPGVAMPRISLGTCCGSQPKVGLQPWISAGGRAVDTAYDYGKNVPGGTQEDVASVLQASSYPRESIFITTKIPAGLDFSGKQCRSLDPNVALQNVKENLMELNVSYVDLVLLHAPCRGLFNADKQNAALWQGLEDALAQNLTRAIGVSSYNSKELTSLLSTAKVVPAVNQCDMSLKNHDDETITFCQQHNITYEAFYAMKGCDFSSDVIQGIATAHSVSIAQVCLRWVLQRGCIMAVGTGANATSVGPYAAEDLNIYGFELGETEMNTLNAL
jgi:diketogulonate reductase-like aldo/keto reductase